MVFEFCGKHQFTTWGNYFIRCREMVRMNIPTRLVNSDRILKIISKTTWYNYHRKIDLQISQVIEARIFKLKCKFLVI